MLVRSRPFEKDGPAGKRAGNERGIECGIVGTVVTVTTGPRRMDQFHAFGPATQRFGDTIAQRVDPLGVGPHRQPFALKMGQRSRRADRGVHLEGPLKARAQCRDGIGGRFRLGRNRLLDGSAVDDGQAGARIGEEQLPRVARVEVLLRRPPRRRLDTGGELRCRPLVGVGDGQEAAVTNQMSALEAQFDLGLQPVEVPMLVRWPHHTGVEHAGQRHIVHETGGPGCQPGERWRLERAPQQAVLLGRLDRNLWIDGDR